MNGIGGQFRSMKCVYREQLRRLLWPLQTNPADGTRLTLGESRNLRAVWGQERHLIGPQLGPKISVGDQERKGRLLLTGVRIK